ncbi:hypothetical protein BH23CHL2_BH23CHL2_20700 [soil metagenome]
MAPGDWLWLIWTALLSGFPVIIAGPNLGNFPGVSGDDSWIMSASHKLATEGVFGSDLYQGFANAERRYFIALPVYHFLQAGSFAVFGTSVGVARAVTLVSGVVVLWCVAWLARRWHGAAVAVVAASLIVFWRTNLLNLASGLSFLSVSRTGRYDMTAVAFVLLSLVGMEMIRDRERRDFAFATGVLAGLATLTQFFGAFVAPLIAVLLVVERGWSVYREPVARWLAAGWFGVVAPYALYVSIYWTDFAGQSALKTGRMEFGSPSFYLDNLVDEPDRYRHLFDDFIPALNGQYERFDQPLSPLLFGVAAIVSLVAHVVRIQRGPSRGERWLAAAIAVPGLCLALFDGTNATLYAAVLLPFICIAIAHAAVLALRWSLRQRSLAIGVAAGFLVVAPAVIVANESIAAYQQERVWSGQIVQYDDAAAEIEARLPAGQMVLGAERWWAGMHDSHSYVAVTALTRQLVSADERNEPAQLVDIVARYGIGAIVVDDDCRATIQRLPLWLQEQFTDLFQNHAEVTGTVNVQSYGEVVVYVLR